MHAENFGNIRNWQNVIVHLIIYNNFMLAIGLIFGEQRKKFLLFSFYKTLQQVMRFAELTQEVQVARQEQVRFDTGLTPGRRRLHKQYKEAVAKMQEEGLDAENAPVPFIYSMGPPFPKLEVGLSCYLYWSFILFLLISFS